VQLGTPASGLGAQYLVSCCFQKIFARQCVKYVVKRALQKADGQSMRSQQLGAGRICAITSRFTKNSNHGAQKRMERQNPLQPNASSSHPSPLQWSSRKDVVLHMSITADLGGRTSKHTRFASSRGMSYCAIRVVCARIQGSVVLEQQLLHSGAGAAL
jgi:hypothetical protein